MTTVSGLPPAVASLPGVAFDRFPSSAAVQARQADAASGRTPGAGDAPITRHGIVGLAGPDRIEALQQHRLTRDLPPDPEELTGPPPKFEITPLEKLKYPPPPLQELARRLRESQTNDVRQPAPEPALTDAPARQATGPTDNTDGAVGEAADKASGYEVQIDALGNAAAVETPAPAALDILR